jgi:hypothetical protein
LTPLLDDRDWVSGLNKTKTYGKTAMVRGHEVQQTLPRIGLFGKATDQRRRLINDLCTSSSSIELLFSGKLQYTTINMMAESLTVGSSSLGQDPCLQVSDIERVLHYRRF